MKTLSMLVAGIVIACFLLAGCASTPEPKVETLYYPEWYGKQSEVGDYVYAYGEATKADNLMALESARAMAFNEAAQYVENYVQAMTKDFMQEAGSNNPQVLQLTERTIKMVSNAKFSGATASEREIVRDGERYRAFVRLSIPASEIKNLLYQNIQNEEALYNEFKATQSFKELEKEIEKMKEQ
jgi:hypothetical protein